MDKYYVYKHTDRGKVVYIGMGTKARAWDIKFRSPEHSDYMINILHKKISSIKVVKYFDNKLDACKYENELIQKLKPKFNKTWTPEFIYKVSMNQPARKPVSYMNIKYNSINECSRKTGIPRSTLKIKLQNSVRR